MVFGTHKTRQRRVDTRRNQLEVGVIALTQLEGRKLRKILGVEGLYAVDEFATEGGDEAVL